MLIWVDGQRRSPLPILIVVYELGSLDGVLIKEDIPSLSGRRRLKKREIQTQTGGGAINSGGAITILNLTSPYPGKPRKILSCYSD